MEWLRPSLKSINDRIQTSLGDSLGLKIPLQKASIINALSMATAGSIHLLYGNLEWVKKQMIPDSADSIALEWWAKLFGVSRQLASAARVQVRFKGTAGVKIVKDTIIKRQLDGGEYITKSDGIIPASGELLLECESKTFGAASTPSETDLFDLSNPIGGVESTGINVSKIILPGKDTESDARLFARFRDRVRYRGQGGNQGDYIFWAQQVRGVGKVWPNPAEKSGLIDVFAISDDISNPLLTDKQRQDVEDKLNKEKPLGARIDVPKLIRRDIKFSIRLYQQDEASQKAVIERLKHFFFEQTSPGSIIQIKTLKDEVGKAVKDGNFELNLPKDDITLGVAEFALFGGVKWSN